MSIPPRICLIDDNAATREAISLGLRDAGYDVASASGGAAGLEVLRRGGIDVIVTDINMPGTSGVQLIAEARRDHPSMPIVAISGGGPINTINMVAPANTLGADAVLLKPFRAKQLTELVERLLATRRETL